MLTRYLVTTPHQVLGAFEEYDLASRSWVRRAEMATPRSHLALACVLNTTLVAVGKGLGFKVRDRVRVRVGVRVRARARARVRD